MKESWYQRQTKRAMSVILTDKQYAAEKYVVVLAGALMGWGLAVSSLLFTLIVMIGTANQ